MHHLTVQNGTNGWAFPTNPACQVYRQLYDKSVPRERGFVFKADESDEGKHTTGDKMAHE